MTMLRETIGSETGGPAELRRKPAVRRPYPPPSEPTSPAAGRSLARADLDTSDGRFEYRDGDTEAAWVCDPAGLGHEQPAMRLTRRR